MKTFLLPLVASLGLAVGGNALANVSLQQTGSFGTSTYVNTNAAGSNASTSYGQSQGALILQEGGSSVQFQAYCIDPKTGTNLSANTYVKTDLNTFFTGNAAGSAGTYAVSGYNRQMTNGNYADQSAKNTATNALLVRDNLVELFSYAYADSLTSVTNATAFSLAVWEIMMQDGGSSGTGGFSLSTGELRSNGLTAASWDNNSDSVLGRASQYLTALGAASEGTAWSNLGLGVRSNYSYTVYYDNNSPFSQNFIRVMSTGDSGQVPLPGTLALAGLGLFGVAAARRRKA